MARAEVEPTASLSTVNFKAPSSPESVTSCSKIASAPANRS